MELIRDISLKEKASPRKTSYTGKENIINIYTRCVAQLCLHIYKNINANYSSFQNYIITILEGWGEDMLLCSEEEK